MIEDLFTEQWDAESRARTLALPEMGIDQSSVDVAFSFSKLFITYGALSLTIPALRKADSGIRGIMLGSLDPNDSNLLSGNLNPDMKVSLQSLAKVFTQGYNLEVLESDPDVLSRRERPGNEPWNTYENMGTNPGEISMQADACHPYYNQGGISSSDFEFNDFLGWVREILGDSSIDYSTSVFNSEISCDYANREIAKRLALGPGKRFGIDEQVALKRADNARLNYTKTCSVEATLSHILRFGQMLANGGIDIYSGERVFKTENAQRLIEDLATGGMYQDSPFYFDLSNVPGKSSISGLVLGIVPGRGAFVAYDPILGLNGNSNSASASLYSVGKLLLPEHINLVDEEQAKTLLYEKQDRNEVEHSDAMLRRVVETGESVIFISSGAKEREDRRRNPFRARINDELEYARPSDELTTEDTYLISSYSRAIWSTDPSVVAADVASMIDTGKGCLLPTEERPTEVAFVKDGRNWRRLELYNADPVESDGFCQFGTFDLSTSGSDQLYDAVRELAQSNAKVIRVSGTPRKDTYTLLAA